MTGPPAGEVTPRERRESSAREVASGPPLAKLIGIERSFGATQAVAGVDLELYPGEVFGLVGANGAGKSTLMRILAGALRPEAGHIEVRGRRVTFADPLDAQRHGIQAVQQEVDAAIVPGFTVAENLVLDRLGSGSRGVIWRRGEARRAAAGIAERLGLDADLDLPVERLGISQRQQVVIARALAREPSVLILDEPTSALSRREAERLFAAVRRLRSFGLAVVYISHRLAEIAELSDRVGVMRDARLVRTFVRPFSGEALIEAMLGHLSATPRPRSSETAREVLRLDAVRIRPFDIPIDLSVFEGEVLGILGLVGAGKSELALGLFGARTFAGGAVTLDDRPFAPRHPADAIAQGVSLVPEDRAAEAILPGWSVAANLSLPFLGALGPLGFIDARLERRRAQARIRELGIVAAGAGAGAPIGSLSGGNQQKVVVGRWLVAGTRLLVLDEPFRGIDIGARADLVTVLRSTAASRATIVLSSDPDELLEVADRIAVLADGALIHVEPVSSADRRRLLALMTQRQAA